MQALPSLTVAARAAWVEPVQAFLDRTEAAVSQDCEALTDGGRDRMFVSASGCLSRSHSVLAEAFTKIDADHLVRTPFCVHEGCEGGADAACSLSGSSSSVTLVRWTMIVHHCT